MKQLTADVTVVGAGLLGALVARACRKQGLDVLLLEADDVAAGASVVRAEPVFDQGEAVLLQSLAPELVQEFSVVFQGAGAGEASTDELGVFPTEPSDPPGNAAVVDTNRLTVLTVLAALRGGARLQRREFVSSVTSEGDRFRLTASTVSVTTKAVVDATGGEGIAGSFRFSVPDQAPDQVQWLRAERPFRSVVVCHETDAASSWIAVPDLMHCWVFFPHGAPLQLGRVLDPMEKTIPAQWRSTREVSASPGYIFPPGMRPGQMVPYASQVAASLAELCEGPRAEQQLPLAEHVADLDSVALSERYRLSGWVGRRLQKLYGADASKVLDAATTVSDRSLLCPCEGILVCEMDHAVRHELVTTLDDAARRIDLGEGPCRGTRCVRQAALMLVAAGVLEAEAFAAHADAFVRNRLCPSRAELAEMAPQQEWLAMARAYGGN